MTYRHGPSILFLIAFILFLLATFIALGAGSFTHEAALVPGGLMFLAAGFLWARY